MIRIDGDGALGDLDSFFRAVPQTAAEAMRIAINDTASKSGMRLIKDAMTGEIGFPSGYLTNDKIGVTKRATNSSLEATITGRKRATSLARFASGSPGGRQSGVTVRVQRGRSSFMRGAFLVRLNQGASLSEDKYNVGLAVRLRPGEKLNKKTQHQSWLVKDKVALLYAPSVDQVFGQVIDQVEEPIGELVAREFYRQFARLSNG